MDKALDQLFTEDPADAISGSERGISFVKQRVEAVGFPKGWYREELIRSGAGVMNPCHKIVHYFSPDGRKYQSKAALTRFFGTRLDLTNFDFKSGKMLGSFTGPKKMASSSAKQGPPQRNGNAGPPTGAATMQRFLDPPLRQCTCIYNQKVRVVETCGQNVCKEAKDLPRSAGVGGKVLKPKPVQVYWAKRLENCRENGEEMDVMRIGGLPPGFMAATSLITESTAVASLAASIYNANTNQAYVGPDNATVVGQTQTVEKLRLNPYVINPYQPMISAPKVTVQSIEEQELQVQRLRRDLARLLAQQRREQA